MSINNPELESLVGDKPVAQMLAPRHSGGGSRNTQGIEQGKFDEDSMVTGQPMMMLSNGKEGGTVP
jgi:hypothetical protein